ncbi:hypothetical protein N802_07980 [Knoellia sinensis KCTC 19936]|uniref:DUF559 domain-containing protein n=1 Tax=Knoellia sinensis KCTC 19936 TaxID=1385520 RepID=A0A0A0JED0_9MICO|nr:hypothetical protein [Knoellia sinensis]KGN33956.1 hypothetical protein N802_07980 [Knoellia sinensis KCTC 19936]
MRPQPLPEELAGGPFSTARARELGLPRMRLHRGDLVHPTHGAHSLRAPVTVEERAAAFAMGMPSARAFSHVTCAVLRDLPLPHFLEDEGRHGPLDVMAPTRGGQVAREGCRGHRGLEIREVEEVGGLSLIGLADTWCDLGELGRGRLTVDDFVVMGDAIVARLDARSEVTIRAGSRTSPGVRALHAALGRRVRPRGKVMLTEALTLIRPRVKSPMESRSRLMFVRAGFPEPEVNGIVLDEAGEYVAEADLLWRAKRVAAEYQGSVHADIKARSADEAKRRLLESLDHTVRELFADDVFRAPRRIDTLEFVARALDLDPRDLMIA